LFENVKSIEHNLCALIKRADLDLLEENMEENENAQSGAYGSREPDKLGRLHFKLDYDFQQNEVDDATFYNTFL